MPAFSLRGARTRQGIACLFVCLIPMVTNCKRAAKEYSPHSGHIGLTQSRQCSGRTRLAELERMLASVVFVRTCVWLI